MVSEKTAISQRWDVDFQKIVKSVASKYGTTMTQLTIEALEVMIALSDIEVFTKMNESERRQLVLQAAISHIEANIPKDEFGGINTENLSEIGLIRDKVEHLLRNNVKIEFTTNDIAKILDIPQSTARTYVRDISEQDTLNYQLVKGRPNKIYYRG